MGKAVLVAVSVLALLVPFPRAQAPEYVRGDLVRLITPADGDSLPDCRVIAVAGDQIRVDRMAVTVNGATVGNLPAGILQDFAETWDETVPSGHYFVIGERVNTSTSRVRYHGLIPAEKIAGKL